YHGGDHRAGYRGDRRARPASHREGTILMRSSLILQAATRFLMPLMLLFSLFLVWRGHNFPGGGFVGGLVAASVFVLYGLSAGVAASRQALRVDPSTLLSAGLGVALLSGLPGVL